MKKLLVLITITLFISCHSTEDIFIGIWMGDKGHFFNPNEKNLNNSLTQRLPILLDFKKGKKLTLKVFGSKTYENIKWEIENDTLLNINNIKYKIRKATKDTIYLELDSGSENYDYKIYRIKNSKIELDSSSVIDKITKNIWSNLKDYPKNESLLEFENHVEYYKNSVRLLKYNVPLEAYGFNNSSDSILNIYNNRWAIGKYKNYFFISNCDHQLYGTSPYENIYQITKVNDNELNIYRPQWTINRFAKFYNHKEVNDKNKNDLIGLWKSKNTEDKKYTIYPRKVNASEKFKGDLYYHFSSSKLKIYGTKTDTIICNWYLNRDKSVLFYFSEYEEENIKGITAEVSEIKKMNEKSLELNLFFNNIYKDHNQYKLNINQEFVKIKNH